MATDVKFICILRPPGATFTGIKVKNFSSVSRKTQDFLQDFFKYCKSCILVQDHFFVISNYNTIHKNFEVLYCTRLWDTILQNYGIVLYCTRIRSAFHDKSVKQLFKGAPIP